MNTNQEPKEYSGEEGMQQEENKAKETFTNA